VLIPCLHDRIDPLEEEKKTAAELKATSETIA